MITCYRAAGTATLFNCVSRVRSTPAPQTGTSANTGHSSRLQRKSPRKRNKQGFCTLILTFRVRTERPVVQQALRTGRRLRVQVLLIRARLLQIRQPAGQVLPGHTHQSKKAFNIKSGGNPQPFYTLKAFNYFSLHVSANTPQNHNPSNSKALQKRWSPTFTFRSRFTCSFYLNNSYSYY